MTASLNLVQATQSLQIAAFFQQSSGQWLSQRRYYTLPDGETREMVSFITVCFLEQGCRELQHLAVLHQLSNPIALTCGTRVTWKSTDRVTNQKQSEGSMVLGVSEKVFYRDRSFMTSKPITAEYNLTNSQTLYLRTEYNGSVLEEEFKLIGQNYRTRQTIISRAGQQQMIGQYLETRVSEQRY